MQDDDKFWKKLSKVISKKSIEFTGTDISDSFRDEQGNFRLYGKHFFKSSDGVNCYWTGVNTENSKGFSIQIVKV